ncbi:MULTISPECIES: hypothetical protein [unclassified Halomonas]|uniref:hypothetical protein n=1 Tax=unclassified Halomonas TaxID=2609666 RepID=UPI0007DA24B1|nr:MULTISPECIES: hypothetical protein [unclassified Halomonas]MBT2788047.1 hypothetical protein [Halomonas sp. ISL-106]MBT2795796.1 hypothetical protein [Halomonas sp. ISL-104]OAL61087.1 hypothetical protein A6R74_15915 [Halomonas sp. ALS9]
MSIPALNTNDVMDTIAALDVDRLSEGDFQVRLVRNEIKKVRKHAPAIAYMLDGILSARLNDYPTAKSHHERSVALAPSDKTILWNYSASMTTLAHYEEASRIVQRLVELGHAGPQHLESLIWLSLTSLDTEALSYNVELVQKSGFEPSQMIESPELAHSLLTILNFTSDFPNVAPDLKRIYMHVQNVLESKSSIVMGVYAEEDDFYHQRVLHIGYLVEAEQSDKIIALNDLLLEKISADEAIEHWDIVIPSFVLTKPDGETQGLVVYASNA